MARRPARHSASLLPFDLAGLQHALLVEQHGSMRQATQVLGVRPSVVSRHVRGLEDVIGVSLFHRTSKGVQATNAGADLFERGRAVVADLELLKQRAAQSGKGLDGRLRFSLGVSAAPSRFYKLLSTYGRQYPDVEVEICEHTARESSAAVRALTLDFAITGGRPTVPGFEVDVFWHEPLFVALAERHPLAAAHVLSRKDLECQRCIVSRAEAGPSIEDHINTALSRSGQRVDIWRVPGRREAVLALVSLEKGISIVRESETGAYPGVVFRALDHEQMPLSLVWSAQNDNPAFRRFLSAARKQAAERHPDALPPP